MREPPSTRQIFIGIFICGQLLFLLTANFIGYAKDMRPDLLPSAKQAVEAVAPGWTEEKGHFWNLMDTVGRLDKMWAQATGQLQAWSLFAPGVGRDCVFAAVELRWDEDPASASALTRPLAMLATCAPLSAAVLAAAERVSVSMATPLHHAETVLSENEPTDLDHYVRIGRFRLRRYENNLVLFVKPDGNETDEQGRARWSDKVRAHVADYAEILHGYLRWRARSAMARWPGRQEPRQVILGLRRYHINDVDKAPPYWSGPHEFPLARWQPGATWDDDHEPIEWYDPITERFKSLHK